MWQKRVEKSFCESWTKIVCKRSDEDLIVLKGRENDTIRGILSVSTNDEN